MWGGRPAWQGPGVRLGQRFGLGTGGRFARHVDICIYSLWYDITAYIHSPGPLHIGCFTAGVFLRIVLSQQHFPPATSPVIITIIIILVIPFKINDYLISVFGLLWIFPLLPWGVWAQSGDGQAWSSKKWPSSKSGGRLGALVGCTPPGMRAQGSPQTLAVLDSCQHPPFQAQGMDLRLHTAAITEDCAQRPSPAIPGLSPASACFHLASARSHFPPCSGRRVTWGCSPQRPPPRALPPAQALCENLLQPPPKRSWPPRAWDPMSPLPMRDKSLQTQM